LPFPQRDAWPDSDENNGDLPAALLACPLLFVRATRTPRSVLMGRQPILTWSIYVVLTFAITGCATEEPLSPAIESARSDPEMVAQLAALQDDGWGEPDWTKASIEHVSLPVGTLPDSSDREFDRISIPMTKTSGDGEVLGRAHVQYVKPSSGNAQIAVQPDDEHSAALLRGENVPVSGAPGEIEQAQSGDVEHCYDNGVAGHRFKACLHFRGSDLIGGAWVDAYTDPQYSDITVRIDERRASGAWITGAGGSAHSPYSGKLRANWFGSSPDVTAIGACLWAQEGGAIVERCVPSIPVSPWSCSYVSKVGVNLACYRIPDTNQFSQYYYITSRKGPRNGHQAWNADYRGNARVCPNPQFPPRSIFVCGNPPY
jgi:hypothetical protein